MKRTALYLTAACIAAAAFPAHATNGMRMIGFGPAQVSMGGASAALPLDAASIITNPAGISELGRRIDFGASYFNPTVKYQATEVAQVPQAGLAVLNDGKTFTSESRRPSGLRKTRRESNSLGHRTTWLRSDFASTSARRTSIPP